jgi:hypothetical protein
MASPLYPADFGSVGCLYMGSRGDFWKSARKQLAHAVVV